MLVREGQIRRVEHQAFAARCNLLVVEQPRGIAAGRGWRRLLFRLRQQPMRFVLLAFGSDVIDLDVSRIVPVGVLVDFVSRHTIAPILYLDCLDVGYAWS